MAPRRIPAGGAAQHWARALTAVAVLGTDQRTLTARLGALAVAHGGRPALLSDDTSLSYLGLEATVERVAQWALRAGLQPGGVVAILMPNCALYAALWLGINRAGGVAALLNTDARGAALSHAIGVAAPSHIIADPDLAAFVSLTDAPPAGRWTTGAAMPGWQSLGLDDRAGAVTGPSDRRLADAALLIYTSGTTGLPKAVTISHGRLLEWSFWFAGMMDAQPQDRMYNCLPMYHSIGGVVAVGAMLVRGAAVVIRPRFSASRFWDDIARTECTIFQYIGELCRYLADAPPDLSERPHRLRLICGNGLTGGVWPRIVERLGGPRVLEYYAATEGSVSLYNVEQRPGAIGRIPPFLAHRFPVAIIRVDGEVHVRDKGLCVACGTDEVGEAIGPVPAQGLYTDAGATAAKILHDVFVPGDRWFRTGDLMRRDADGFFWFVDRVGDTYRWKGENVATAEVASVIGRYPGVTGVCVYGVTVPGQEGRAGMAALTTGAGFDLAGLAGFAAAELGVHAAPVFIRLCAHIATTGTFKPIKLALALDGFDPARCADAVFVLDRAQGYQPLDTPRHDAIVAGASRI